MIKVDPFPGWEDWKMRLGKSRGSKSNPWNPINPFHSHARQTAQVAARKKLSGGKAYLPAHQAHLDKGSKRPRKGK